MATPSVNLSFSTNSNQPKILINGSQAVSVPAGGPSTLITVATGASVMPIPPRVTVERSGKFYPIYGATGDTAQVDTVNILYMAAYTSLFSLVVRSFSNEVGATSIILHYRVYADGKGP